LEIKSFLSTLKEDKIRIIIKDFLSKRCGHTELYHSTSEQGVDLASLYEKRYDFINRDVTVLVQVKNGKISPKELRENIFGQMSEVFVRSINHRPFHMHNPRRLLLIINGELTKVSRDLIESWNNKIPIPIEYIEENEFTDFLVEEYSTLENIKKIVAGEDIPIQVQSIELEEIKIIGSEDPVGFLKHQ
jgi:hypothetical protein